jgi:hypothetical protein
MLESFNGLTGKDVEGSVLGLFSGTIPVFSWTK